MQKILFFLMILSSVSVWAQLEKKSLKYKNDSIEILISTFLGNETRNYYGNKAPEKLDTIWRFYLGEGLSPAYGTQKIWKGAGWTGQPLLVREKGELFLIQGAFDYHLRKIKARTGEVVWQYKFDDILKATGTIWINENEPDLANRYVIMQGSRKGWDKDKTSKYCTSFRAVSYITGKELWRLNSKATDCYSRDVDGSGLVINDTAYLCLENGIFTVFNPDYRYIQLTDSLLQPQIHQEIVYYNNDDIKAHGDDLVSEASPTLLNNRIFTLSGTGWIYGYNKSLHKNDWQFYLGSDMNGSAPATFDNCLLIPVEKQYIKGRGGVMKINPEKTGNNAVVWYFPVDTLHWFHWEGGLIGSVSVNDNYNTKDLGHLAVFNDVAGYLYVISQTEIEKNKKVAGPDSVNYYPTPKLLCKEQVEGTIGTPIIIDDKIIAPTDKGLFLYRLTRKKKEYKLELLDKIPNFQTDATPIVWDGYLYLASADGYLYCFGKR